MKLKNLFLIAFFTLLSLTPGVAQNHQMEAQQTAQLVQLLLRGIPTQIQMCESLYSMAQQTGNQQQMQLCQMEYQMHQGMYQGLQQLMQNPNQLMDPQRRQQVLAGILEYRYRTNYRDMRPYQEIQGNLAQFAQQERYNASASGINANTAAMTANHNQRMKVQAAQAASHQNNMNSMQAQWDANNRSWANNQNINHNSHQQFVHGIYNEYKYVDPNTNQGYWVPMSVQNPAVVNPDGSVTELQPFHNY